MLGGFISTGTPFIWPLRCGDTWLPVDGDTGCVDPFEWHDALDTTLTALGFYTEGGDGEVLYVYPDEPLIVAGVPVDVEIVAEMSCSQSGPVLTCRGLPVSVRMRFELDGTEYSAEVRFFEELVIE